MALHPKRLTTEMQPRLHAWPPPLGGGHSGFRGRRRISVQDLPSAPINHQILVVARGVNEGCAEMELLRNRRSHGTGQRDENSPAAVLILAPALGLAVWAGLIYALIMGP